MSLGLCVVGCGAFARTFVKGVRGFGGLSSQVDLYFASGMSPGPGLIAGGMLGWTPSAATRRRPPIPE